MEYLVTVDEVKTRMGLPADIVDGDDIMESAIFAAQNYVIGRLETALDIATGTDIFHLVKDKFPTVVAGHYRCRLKRGFVHATGLEVSVGDDAASGTLITDYQINLDKGIVYIPEAYEGKYVQVAYASGLNTTDHLPPTWLKDAILSYVPGVLNTTQQTHRKDEYKTTLEQSDALAGAILAPNLRGTAFHYRPLF